MNWLLHYPMEVLVNICKRNSDQREIYVIVYAISTLSRIAILIHYLAIMWIWIGSDYFVGFEQGFDPWLISIEDFAGYTMYRSYIFSVYWVCTVVTTVGYGDYSGGTSLELIYTILLEFSGIMVFSVMQVAVL